MDLKEVELYGDSIDGHWYYESKARYLMELLKNCDLSLGVTDVGSGSGYFAKKILQHTDAPSAVCVDIEYPYESEEELCRKPLYRKKYIDKSTANLVLMMDVIEHVDDDLGLLNEYIVKSPEFATFMITVPAFNFLWCSHDIFLGHKRRYTLSSLNVLADSANLEILSSGYLFFGIFPAAVISRLVDKIMHSSGDGESRHQIHHNKYINWLLNFICRLEIPFIGKNKLFGLTVYCVARKKKSYINKPETRPIPN